MSNFVPSSLCNVPKNVLFPSASSLNNNNNNLNKNNNNSNNNNNIIIGQNQDGNVDLTSSRVRGMISNEGNEVFGNNNALNNNNNNASNIEATAAAAYRHSREQKMVKDFFKSNPETLAKVSEVIKKYKVKSMPHSESNSSNNNCATDRDYDAMMDGDNNKLTPNSASSSSSSSSSSSCYFDSNISNSSGNGNGDLVEYWRTVARHYISHPSATHDPTDPFYVVDLGRVITQMAKFRHCLPMVQPFYAVKCNNNEALIEMLSALGASFDCASQKEIKMILEGKYVESPDDIIFANPCKSTSCMRVAAALGVRYVTFDNVQELEKLASYMPNCKAVLRIKTNDTNAVCAFSTKFGASMADVPALLQRAAKLGVQVVGVSFHVGSGNNDPQAYIGSITDARSVFDEGEALGFDMKLLDLGGGWSGSPDGPPIDPMTGKPTDLDFEDICAQIRPVLERHFPHTTIIAEPGRFFSAASHMLAVNVHSYRTVPLPAATVNKLVASGEIGPDAVALAAASASTSAVPGGNKDEDGSGSGDNNGAGSNENERGENSESSSSSSSFSSSSSSSSSSSGQQQQQLMEHQYYINDGLYHSFNCIVFDHAHPPLYPVGNVHSNGRVGNKQSPSSDSNVIYNGEEKKDEVAAQDSDEEDKDVEKKKRKQLLREQKKLSAAAQGKLTQDHPSYGNNQSISSGNNSSNTNTNTTAPLLHISTIFGPTCDSLDCILKRQLFPQMEIGDWLFIPEFGSYTTAGGCPFNGFSTQRTEYINSLSLSIGL